MSRLFTRPGLLLAATLVLSATGVAHAQEAPPATPPVPPVPPATALPATTPPAPVTAGKVDPEARKLIEKMVAAHQALTSYSGKLNFVAKQGEKTQTVDATLAYAKPNKVSVTSTNATTKAISSIVSDGKSRFTTSSEAKDKYTKSEASAGADNIGRAFGEAGAGTGLLSMVLIDPQAADKVLPGLVTSLTIEPDATVNGVMVSVINAEGSFSPKPGSPPPPTLKFTFAIGKEDSLMRRVVVTGSESGNIFSLTEEYAEVKANPALPPATFSFTPPAGAKQTVQKEEDDAMFDPRLKVGAAPLPFSGTDLSGKPVSFAAYKGKVVLVDFWATWCGPCRGEVPNVVAAYNKYKAAGFDVIGVSLDEAGDREKLISYAKENKMPWRQIYDGKGWNSAIAKAYSIKAIPFTMLIGRDGKIAAIGARGDQLEPAVKAALAK